MDSAEADGAFCLPCAHQTSSKKGIQLDRLLHSPINTWTSATRKFKEHETNSETHKSALLIASEFKRSMEHASVSVHHQIDQAVARMAEANRAKLASILKTMILCGKQNLPLRGHRDDSQDLDVGGSPGNFQKAFRILY